MLDMNQVVTGVTLTKACSIKPDGESTEKKVIHLKVKFDGARISDVFAKALSGTVITWQNGVGRKAFDTFVNGQTVDITFTAPATQPQIDPVTAIIASAKAAGMTVEEYLMAEMKKRSMTE